MLLVSLALGILSVSWRESAVAIEPAKAQEALKVSGGTCVDCTERAERYPEPL
jgi:hypothetical protein